MKGWSEAPTYAISRLPPLPNKSEALRLQPNQARSSANGHFAVSKLTLIQLSSNPQCLPGGPARQFDSCFSFDKILVIPFILGQTNHSLNEGKES